jgi:Metallopeptidase toxin 4
MTNDIFDEFDKEGQTLLGGLKFLSFKDLKSGKAGNQDSLATVKTKKSFEEMSNDYSKRSPFGEKSLFNSDAIKLSRNFIVKSGTKWLYATKQSQSGTELIKEYRKYDSVIAESIGNTDEINDFIIYIEDNYTVNLGKILLIKMSDKMINYYTETFLKDPKTEILKSWSSIIIEQNKNKDGFSATVDDIENAFLLEIQYRPLVNNGIIKFTNTEIASMVSSQLSEKIRGIKIDRENWDPTLKSERYKLQSLEKGINYIITTLNEYKNEVSDYRKFIEIINKFSFNSITGNNKLLDDYVLFLKSIEKGIASTIQQIQLTKEKGKEYFAYLCGIINGIFEFICGIIDVIFLILKLVYTIDTIEKPELELDVLELREGLEELTEAWLKDPDFLSKRIQEMLKAYEYARYNDPKLTKYQIAHNTGEDLVIAIDIILSFIAIVKAITNSSKYLPKFTEWIDDVVENGGKGGKKLEDIDFLAKWEKAIESKGGLGFLDGQKLNRARIRYWIDEIKKISNEKAVLRVADEGTELFARLKGNRAGFNPFNQELIFQKGMTEYEMLHEYKHLEEFSIIGKDEYIKGMKDLGYSLELDLIRTYKREMYVYNEIMKQANKFNKTELKHARWIIDDIIKDGIDSGIDLTKIKI